MSEYVARYRAAAAGAVAAPISAALIVLGSLAAGWAVSQDARRFQILVVGLAVGNLLALVAAWNFGVATGLLVLAVMNGIPGVDLESYATSGSFRVADVATVALVLLLAVRHFEPIDNLGIARVAGLSRWWGFALGGWWLVTFGRSVLFGGIPMMKAALFGRDFLYFALLVPLFVGGLRSRKEVLGLLGALMVGALLFAFGHLALVELGAAGLGRIFVHETLTNEFGGFQRIYAFMGDAVSATLSLGLGLALMGPSRRLRRTGGFIALLAGVSVLLQFTRATYFGLFFGIVFAGGFWMSRRLGTSTLRRVATVLAGLALIAGFAVSNTSRTTTARLENPQINPSLPPALLVATRVSSGVQDLSSGSGTVGYRYKVDRQMLHILDGHWPIGLGFWHPAAHPVANLPGNSIRSGDVGVLNSMMTMGAIGTVLLYLGPLGVLFAILRSRRGRGPSRDDWFFFGLTAWLVSVLVSSISLVTLFSSTGLVLTAAVLGAALQLLAREPQSLD